jgi:hypothetical protein
VADDATSEKPFVLIWTSQNGEVTLERGRYASIPEASADLPAAEPRLHAEFPADADPHYPHDIKAGTWRVVPARPESANRP